MNAKTKHMVNCLAATLLAALAISAGGCASPTITDPQATLPAGEDSAAWLDRLSSQDHVSQNDAMRGMLMLLDGDDEMETFQQRVERLRQYRVVPDRWDHQADRPVSRGRLAYMIYQACDVQGGLTLTVFGPSRRYALRELQFQGFLGAGSVYGSVTGLEFVAAMDRAATYLDSGSLPVLKTTTGR